LLPAAARRACLGLAPDGGLVDVYEAVGARRPPRARRLWDARRGLVAAGVLYAGRLETTLARWSRWLRTTGLMRWPTAAFATRTVSEQRTALAAAEHDIERGGRIWSALFHPVAVALALQDPSFRRSTEGRIGAYLYGRLVEFAQRRRLRDSFVLHLIWFGGYDPHGALPLWLTVEGAERARKQLARLELRHATLEATAGTMRRDTPVCWSLSDVSAWMDQARFQALIARLVDASAPGSRLCWRHLAAHWQAPSLPRLQLESERSRQLERADTSVFYAIHAARVVEPA
jgi:S-adenosylmethionine:diacylglycerol 3-amino-3-carboxypropyl transferase